MPNLRLFKFRYRCIDCGFLPFASKQHQPPSNPSLIPQEMEIAGCPVRPVGQEFGLGSSNLWQNIADGGIWLGRQWYRHRLHSRNK